MFEKNTMSSAHSAVSVFKLISDVLFQLLYRLRVEYSGFDPISSQRFGAQFVGRVANPNDILLFFKKRKGIPDSLSAASTRNLPELEIEDSNDTSTGLGVQDLVSWI